MLAPTKKHLDGFANQGLRTLLIANKYLNLDWYEEWAKKYSEALVMI
jgi:phospholipid-translocating ATPase